MNFVWPEVKKKRDSSCLTKKGIKLHIWEADTIKYLAIVQH